MLHYHFLRLPWLPYYDIHGMNSEKQEIDFAKPETWKGVGLLELFRHESELVLSCTNQRNDV